MKTAISISADAHNSGHKRSSVALAFLVALGAISLIFLILRHSERTHAHLSDTQIVAFLHDDADPDGIQYALSQLQSRLARRENQAPWVGELLRLANHPAENVRYTVAALMASDPSRPEFHQVLLDMLRYQTVLVRNEAALSLAAFDDPAGREQIMSMLQPISIYSPQAGHVQTATSSGSRIKHGASIVHLQTGNGVVEVLSPITGRVRNLAVQDGDLIPGGTWIGVIQPDADQMLAALAALDKIGKLQDVPVLGQLESTTELPAVVRDRAKLTEQRIRQREQ